LFEQFWAFLLCCVLSDLVIWEAFPTTIQPSSNCPSSSSLRLHAPGKPYLSLRMKGQGTVPKLTFDRREIVLPSLAWDVNGGSGFDRWLG
jgi:hypothetical protein